MDATIQADQPEKFKSYREAGKYLEISRERNKFSNMKVEVVFITSGAIGIEKTHKMILEKWTNPNGSIFKNQQEYCFLDY